MCVQMCVPVCSSVCCCVCSRVALGMCMFVCVCELCKEELITEVAITSVDGYIETQTDYDPLPLPCPATTRCLSSCAALQLGGIKGNQLMLLLSLFGANKKLYRKSAAAWGLRVSYRVTRKF